MSFSVRKRQRRRLVVALPMAEQAIEKSVTKMVAARSPLPRYEDGYRQWKTAKAGAFTVSVAEAVTLAEKALNSR